MVLLIMTFLEIFQMLHSAVINQLLKKAAGLVEILVCIQLIVSFTACPSVLLAKMDMCLYPDADFFFNLQDASFERKKKKKDQARLRHIFSKFLHYRYVVQQHN